MNVVVSARFDDPQALQIRWLQEAAGLGRVHVHLWSDELITQVTGQPPKFPEAERRYFVEALRWVDTVSLLAAPHDPDTLPLAARPDVWVVCERQINDAKRAFCAQHGIECRLIPDAELAGFPLPPPPPPSGRPKVIVTGCYDWFHSGHVRFFEEASEHGELYVVVGHDANVRLLKGAGHPLFSEQERRYLVGAIRYVHEALVSTGEGWMDAEPEIARLRPDIYLVNEDGDKPEKQAFCATHGLRYVVLKRTPKEGLPRRQSTDLRGF
jgi:cytidyltransferase-like protein